MQFRMGEGDPTSPVPFLFKCLTVHGNTRLCGLCRAGSAVILFWRDSSRAQGLELSSGSWCPGARRPLT